MAVEEVVALTSSVVAYSDVRASAMARTVGMSLVFAVRAKAFERADS